MNVVSNDRFQANWSQLSAYQFSQWCMSWDCRGEGVSPKFLFVVWKILKNLGKEVSKFLNNNVIECINKSLLCYIKHIKYTVRVNKLFLLTSCFIVCESWWVTDSIENLDKFSNISFIWLAY